MITVLVISSSWLVIILGEVCRFRSLRGSGGEMERLLNLCRVLFKGRRNGSGWSDGCLEVNCITMRCDLMWADKNY